MRSVALEDILASMEHVHAVPEGETRKFMTRMQKELAYLQVYIAAISPTRNGSIYRLGREMAEPSSSRL